MGNGKKGTIPILSGLLWGIGFLLLALFLLGPCLVTPEGDLLLPGRFAAARPETQPLPGTTTRAGSLEQVVEEVLAACLGSAEAPLHAAARWTGALREGRETAASMLLRMATSTQALLSGLSDDDLVRAAGLFLPDGERTDLASRHPLLPGTARTRWILEVFGQPEFVAACGDLGIRALPPAWGGGDPAGLQPTPVSLDRHEFLSAPPATDAEIVGIVTVSGRIVSASGDVGAEPAAERSRPGIRVDLLVGSLPFGRFLARAGATGSLDYTAEWDTRRTGPGIHRVAVLVRSSDGRGLVAAEPRVRVPEVLEAQWGDALAVPLLTEGTWISVASPGSDLSVQVLDPEGAVHVRCLRLRGESVPASDLPGLLPETVRARGQPGDVYFLRIAGEAGSPADGEPGRTPTAALVFSGDAGRVDTGDRLPLNLREAPGTDKVRIGTIPDGEAVSVTGTGQDGGGRTWSRVRTLAGQEGWVLASYLLPLRADARLADLRIDPMPAAGLSSAFHPETLRYGLVLDPEDDAIRLWTAAAEGPSVRFTARLLQPDGTEAYLSPSPDGILALDGWLPEPGASRLTLSLTGYFGESREIVLDLLRSPDPEGRDVMLQPFPISYRSPLWLQLALHPAWCFLPQETGIPWEQFLEEESRDGLNLVSASQSPASWIRPDSPVHDAPDWVTASPDALAHFADPRNFLTEEGLFQFEILSYRPEVQGIEGVRQLLAGSFMEPGATEADGTPVDFASLFVEAAALSGASPYFLASRCRQELGSAGTHLAFGTLPGFPDVFNFYNIGATPDPSVPNGALVNGARFALYGRDPDGRAITPDEEEILLPWLSRRSAILGGALWIARGYIAVGQDTLYLQKFDVVEEGGLFLHQYAQNLQMAESEALRHAGAYRRLGLLDRPMIFRIPIFRDMPAAPAPRPR